jgi:pimeloyl-ACP methyl ester carboxylesterase
MGAVVQHLRSVVNGTDVFYRQAGAADAPVLLLPHGYPCSSYEFRAFMPRLADRWRLLAPDFPGTGYSATPEDFDYSFDGYADFLEQFLEQQGVERFALYLHDFGSQIGLRLAMRMPHRIAALIIQNGDIYEDAFGDKYEALKKVFAKPDGQARREILQTITKDEFKREFLNDVGAHLAPLLPPDLWELHWPLMTERRREIAAGIIFGLKDNLAWFPRYQAYLREHRPPTLIVWGPQDGYMPEKSARAYLRDLPDAQLHLLEGGHWLLETNLDEVVALCRDFLAKHHGP